MLITLSRRTAICQSVAEVYLTGVTPLGPVSTDLLLFICSVKDRTSRDEENLIKKFNIN